VRLRVRIDATGVRPAGAQPESAPIVRAALDSARALGFESRLDAGSSDSNLPMSLGIPAITIDGGGEGRGAHSLAEQYDDGERGWLGPQWAAVVVLSLAGLSR
jgi:tripeptide aminopeptidase